MEDEISKLSIIFFSILILFNDSNASIKDWIPIIKKNDKISFIINEFKMVQNFKQYIIILINTF